MRDGQLLPEAAGTSLASSRDTQAGFPDRPSLQPAPPCTVLTNESKLAGPLPSSSTNSLHSLPYLPLPLSQRGGHDPLSAKGSRKREAALSQSLANKERGHLRPMGSFQSKLVPSKPWGQWHQLTSHAGSRTPQSLPVPPSLLSGGHADPLSFLVCKQRSGFSIFCLIFASPIPPTSGLKFSHPLLADAMQRDKLAVLDLLFRASIK